MGVEAAGMALDVQLVIKKRMVSAGIAVLLFSIIFSITYTEFRISDHGNSNIFPAPPGMKPSPKTSANI